MFCQVKFTLILVSCLVLMACLPAFDAEMVSQPRRESEASVYGPGPGREIASRRNWSVVSGVALSGTGCKLDYRLYRPSAPRSDGLVVLSHGFLRSQTHMSDLAAQLASLGITTVTLDFCNSRFWDGRHFRNGLDMIRVADVVSARHIVYAGFSAGGLAALVAGRNDQRTVGVLVLDLVDARRLGERMVSGLDRPLIGIMGDPSPCNAQSNGLTVLSMADRARVERVEGAGHCDFESPTDWLCRAVCKQEPVSSAERRRAIMAKAVRATQSLLGLTLAATDQEQRLSL
ncbi:MAG: alpha/beta hydrolase [Sphingobacteriia bacterium]|nr:alpha/beta hydrolase [Sphingobacteriia bacterium]NCC40927.1 alpha/beta hydrolase [Gammaproteobacteria bacterium]